MTQKLFRRMPVSTPELLVNEYRTMDLCYCWMIKTIWCSTPFDDHPFSSLFVILPNHDSLFWFIVEVPGFGGCFFLILFSDLPSRINSVGICLVDCWGQAASQIEAWFGSDLPFISLSTPLTGIIIHISTLAEATKQQFSYI